jgi:peptidoglycan hydrolase-like protein with peptidoglycan-binding domain
MNHAEARQHSTRGFKLLLGRDPSLVEAQVVDGVAWLETQYGMGWRAAGKGSNNMGAVQSGKPPCNPATSFQNTDTSPTSGGGSIPYQACFKKYPTPADGFADVVRNVFVAAGITAKDAPQPHPHHRGKEALAAAKQHDLFAVSAALYDGSYYQSFGPNRITRISHHYRALRSAVNRSAAVLGEKMPNGNDPLVRVMKFTFPFIQKGDDVRRVQRMVGYVGKDIDGWYGTGTRARVRALQSATPGLEVDGVVGLDTWDVIQDMERERGYVLEAA